MTRRGPRSRKRAQVNRLLKAEAERCGVRSCELMLEGCQVDFALSWAHSKKSRFLLTDEDWMEACCSCIACHMAIEAMSHAAMERLVLEALGRRSS